MAPCGLCLGDARHEYGALGLAADHARDRKGTGCRPEIHERKHTMTARIVGHRDLAAGNRMGHLFVEAHPGSLVRSLRHEARLVRAQHHQTALCRGGGAQSGLEPHSEGAGGRAMMRLVLKKSRKTMRRRAGMKRKALKLQKGR